jgi:hypothetical protein
VVVKEQIEQLEESQLTALVNELSKPKLKQLALLAVIALEPGDIADIVVAARNEFERIEEEAAAERERAFAKVARPKGKDKTNGTNSADA